MQAFKDVDEYIASFPHDVQEKLQLLRKTIHQEVSGCEESMSYKMPTFLYKDKYVIYFAAWKKHISLYPFTGEMVKDFKEAAHYITSGKGTIQFPLDQPLPLSLIRSIVVYRLKEVQSA